MITFNDSSFFDKPHTLNECIQQELGQFKMHQLTKLDVYRTARLDFLKGKNNSGLSVDYVTQFSPKIAVFPGSFNPFHKGHYNVLQKAEKIFDKVIIAFGNNPDKDGQKNWGVPASIKNRQIENYTGLLTDFVKQIGEEIVVIRGLRNSTDFQYEQNQYRYIQELMPNIKIVNIFCDKEFEHISSSGIRTLEKYNKHQNYLLD
jgi:pantetheine-phosphate adenylyltransferase